MSVVGVGELVFDYQNAFIRDVPTKEIKRERSDGVFARLKLDVDSEN